VTIKKKNPPKSRAPASQAEEGRPKNRSPSASEKQGALKTRPPSTVERADKLKSQPPITKGDHKPKTQIPLTIEGDDKLKRLSPLVTESGPADQSKSQAPLALEAADQPKSQAPLALESGGDGQPKSLSPRALDQDSAPKSPALAIIEDDEKQKIRAPSTIEEDRAPITTPFAASGQINSLGQEENEVLMTENQIIETDQQAPPQAPPTPPTQDEVDEIIRNRVYASIAVGLVPVPLVDLGALTAVQLELIYRLSKAYDIPFNQKWARKAVAFLLGSLAPVFLAPNLSGLLRYVPVIGPTLGATGGSITFATATYLVGHAFAKRFAKGEQVDDKELKSIGQEIKDGFEKGKSKVKGLFGKGESPAEAAPEAVN
jgi:uncharacterized protein (DUF697 family)